MICPTSRRREPWNQDEAAMQTILPVALLLETGAAFPSFWLPSWQPRMPQKPALVPPVLPGRASTQWPFFPPLSLSHPGPDW